jgi:hypothetical protein
MTNRARDQAELNEILLPEPEGGPPPPRRLRKGRANTPFVMVPMAWVERLTPRRSGAAWVVAMRLLHLDWKSAGRPVVLANVTLRELGFDRRRKSDGLAILEELGLVSVEHRPRQSPRVTLHK